MRSRDVYWRRYKIQKTLCIGQWLSPLQSRLLGTSHSSPSCHQLPHCIFLNLTNGLNSSLSQVILVLGKAKSHRAPNLGCRGGWVIWVIWCFTQKLCMRCDTWAGTLLWWGCQSPVAHSCGLLNHPNNFRRGMFKLNARFDADLLLYPHSFRMQ